MKRMLTVLAVAQVTAYGATVSNLTSTDNQRNAYSIDSKWSGGVAPGSSGSGDYDYVVANGYALWLPEQHSDMTFGGHSLALGEFTTSGSLYLKGNDRYVTFPDLHLYKGGIYQSNNGSIGIDGTAAIHSTVEDPFVLWFKGDYNTYLKVTLVGDETSAIRVDAGISTMPVYTWADQSKTYSGSWILGPNVYFRPTSAAPGSNASSAMVFGKPLTTFNPAALVAYGGTIIRYEVGDLTFAKSDNRGITLKEAATTPVSYLMVNGTDHHMYWSICGDPGSHFRLTNDGKFHLYASCGVKLSTEINGKCIFLHSGASITSEGALVLASGQVATVSDAMEMTIWNPELTDAGFDLATSGGKIACIHVFGTPSITGRIKLTSTALPAVTEAKDVPVMIIDKSVKRVFTKADFDLQIAADSYSVTRNEDGDQVVSIRLLPYVQSKNTYTYCETDGDWSDGRKPEPGKDYMVKSEHYLRSSATEGSVATFKGDRLLLLGGIVSKHSAFQFEKLTVLGGTSFHCNGYGGRGGVLQSLTGVLDVRTPDEDPFVFNLNRSTGVLNATVSGFGRIRVKASDESSEPRSFEIVGENPDYAGGWSIYNDTSVVNNTFAFKLNAEANLGHPSVFAADALLMGYGCVVTPNASVTISDANRGVTFAADQPESQTKPVGVAFDLAEGRDLTIDTPLVIQSGNYTKRGVGTLAWGKGGTSVGDSVEMNVEAGAVKLQGRDATGAMTLRFSSGTTLAFSYPLAAGDSRETQGVDFSSTTLATADEKLNVRLDFDPSACEGVFSHAKVPLATFADAAAAEAFVSGLKLARVRGCTATLTVEGATVFAKVSRSGLFLVVR